MFCNMRCSFFQQTTKDGPVQFNSFLHFNENNYLDVVGAISIES